MSEGRWADLHGLAKLAPCIMLVLNVLMCLHSPEAWQAIEVHSGSSGSSCSIAIDMVAWPVFFLWCSVAREDYLLSIKKTYFWHSPLIRITLLTEAAILPTDTFFLS